ncbi:hypothetical protein SARC_15987, partial [Sphaeroforma arctica JP610]
MDSLFAGFDHSTPHVNSILKEENLSTNAINSFDGMQFAMPPVGQPSSLLKEWTDDTEGSMKVKIAHGTTTLAFKFKGGVMVCVDSRATGGAAI